MSEVHRKIPNILITGTPGVGKSTLCAELIKRPELNDTEWLEVNKIAKDKDYYLVYDKQYECPVLDEDKVLDELEPIMSSGGKVLDYHSAEMFPERWIDGVFVLTCDNTKLYDRLVEKGHSGKKLQDNLQCEIFQEILEEAKESYKEDIVFQLESNDDDDMSRNTSTIVDWIVKWKTSKGK